MRLNMPKVITWWIAVILGALGVVSFLVNNLILRGNIPILSGIAFWLVVVAWLLLVLGTYFKGL